MPNHVPNLDAMPEEELLAFHEKYSRASFEEAAELVGNRHPDCVTHARLVASYASTKATAMKLRREGNIQEAGFYEEKTDNLYRRLPSKLKW